jgi:hypothetical protein
MPLRYLALPILLCLGGCDGDGAVQRTHDGVETGLILYTDILNGCQYVRASGRDGLTPRMGKDGKQVCN